MTLYADMVTEICINIGSGNGLLPDGTKPLPEPMLTYHQWGPVTITWGQFPVTIKFHSYLPGDNELIHWMSWLTYQMVRSMWDELTFWPMWEPQEHDSFCEARVFAATTLETTATTRGNQAESEILLDCAARGHRNLAMINGYMLRKSNK